MATEQATLDIDTPPAATPAPTAAPVVLEDRGDHYVPPEDDDSISEESLQAVLGSAPPEPTPAPTPGPTPAPTPAPTATPEPAGDMIPKGRFNEVNEQRKRAEAEAERLRLELEASRRPAATPSPTPPPFDEDAAEAQYAELLMDGKTAEAVALRKKINAHVRDAAAADATVKADEAYRRGQQETANQVAERELNEASAKAVQDYPYLDTEEGAEALELIVASRDAKIAKGIAPGEALRQAVNQIAPKFKPAAATAPPAPGATPAPTPAPVDTRAADALARGAADSTKQPPQLAGGTGNRATAERIDVKNLTEAQFDALPEAEKKRLRGDNV